MSGQDFKIIDLTKTLSSALGQELPIHFYKEHPVHHPKKIIFLSVMIPYFLPHLKPRWAAATKELNLQQDQPFFLFPVSFLTAASAWS